MKWKKFRIKTVTEAEDIIISELYDMGLEGAQIEDNIPLSQSEQQQMFVDIPPVYGEDDGTAYLSFFVETAEDGSLIFQGDHTEEAVILEMVRNCLEDIRSYMDIGEGTVETDETRDIDWINNWKEFFHQFYVDDLLIIPSWEEVPEADRGKKILHIDPGTAFGTGMHETTQLCIRQLWKHITPETRLLDVGTGSGILSIVALMYGIASAKGTDLDPCAVEAVRGNLEANGIEADRFELTIGNIITDEAVRDKLGYDCHDIVVANILADVLVPLTPVIIPHLKKGGIYITSGIIEDKEELMRETIEQNGFELLEVTHQGEWVSITARKN